MGRKLHKVVTYRSEPKPEAFERELDQLSAEGYEFVGTVYRADGEPAVLMAMDDPSAAEDRRAQQRKEDTATAESLRRANEPRGGWR